MLTSPEGQPVVALIMGYNGPIEDGEKVLAPLREFGEPLAVLTVFLIKFYTLPDDIKNLIFLKKGNKRIDLSFGII